MIGYRGLTSKTHHIKTSGKFSHQSILSFLTTIFFVQRNEKSKTNNEIGISYHAHLHIVALQSF